MAANQNVGLEKPEFYVDLIKRGFRRPDKVTDELIETAHGEREIPVDQLVRMAAIWALRATDFSETKIGEILAESYKLIIGK